jgi:hypothetical protein
MEAPPRPRHRAAAAAVIAVAFAFGLFALRGEVRSRAGADDSYYLLQTSSLIEDGDLDLRNDVLASGFALHDRLALLTQTTPAGSLENEFSVGPALIWSPAYLAGLALRRTAPGEAAVRWSAAQRAALHLLSLLLLAGLAWFMLRLYALAGPAAPLGAGALAVAALLLGTPLLVYATSVYTMAHLPSAVAAALLVAAALALERNPVATRALLAGGALALVFLVRWQDLVFAALIAAALARRPWRRAGALALWAGLGFLVVASVQLHAWRLERGGWLAVPDPQGAGSFQWAHPALASFLSSGRSGLLAWSPVFALAAAGLLLPWRCRLPRRWAFAALAVLAAEIYLSAARGDWWGGHSFGPRRLSSCVPLLVLGLANLGQLSSRLAAALLTAAIGWGLFAGQVYWSGVQDLSLVLRGTPSATGREIPAEPAVVSDPAEARARCARLSLSPPADYWAEETGASSWGGIAATWALIAAALGALAVTLARASPRGLLGPALWCVLAAAAAAHLRFATGPHPAAAERAAWAGLARQWQAPPRQVALLLAGRPSGGMAVAPANAPTCGPSAESSPAAAYCYLRMFLEWRAGDPDRARTLLAALLARGYPAAREASATLRAAERGGEVLRWIPGTFFRPARGRPAFELPLPPARPGARPVQRWEISCEITRLELVAGELNDLLHLSGAAAEPLADLAVRGGGGLVLATPSAREEAAGRGLAIGERHRHRLRHRLRLRYELAPPAASADLSSAQGAGVWIAVRAPAEPRPPSTVTFGRLPARRLGAYSLRGSSFSDLWITARP